LPTVPRMLSYLAMGIPLERPMTQVPQATGSQFRATGFAQIDAAVT